MMNHKNENMDEEKSFEVIQEESQTKFQSPHLVKRGLTEVSAMFDRTGKGYLDETERALRRMDSQDKGYLGIDKVCVIFESLQAEQERSSQLLEALRTESKKSLNLKKGVIALSVFTVLLALANVGTSFAVSKLVKDMQVGSNGDLQSVGSHTRVGTTSKIVTFEMQSLDETRRRRFLSEAGLVCETMVDTDPITGVTSKDCNLQGIIKMDVASAIHGELQSTDHVSLTCNNKTSLIYGTYKLPSGNPGEMFMGTIEYKVYPTYNSTDDKYEALQRLTIPEQPYVAATATTPEIPYKASYHCDMYFELAFYCPTERINGQLQDCWVMSANMPRDNCPSYPVVCGPAPQAVNPILA